MYVHVNVHVYVCMCMYTYICMYVCMHACMHACMYVGTCVYIHIYIYKGVCVCLLGVGLAGAKLGRKLAQQGAAMLTMSSVTRGHNTCLALRGYAG